MMIFDVYTYTHYEIVSTILPTIYRSNYLFIYIIIYLHLSIDIIINLPIYIFMLSQRGEHYLNAYDDRELNMRGRYVYQYMALFCIMKRQLYYAFLAVLHQSNYLHSYFCYHYYYYHNHRHKICYDGSDDDDDDDGSGDSD